MSGPSSFLTRLRRASKWVQGVSAHESRTIDVQSNYGKYHLVIGPELSARECRQRGLRRHSRPIEVDAQIDHLFVHGDHITPLPEHDVVVHHLQGTVVIRGVAVHIYDAGGKGETRSDAASSAADVAIAEMIDCSGAEGKQVVDHLRSNGTLARAAYQIIQQDILKGLRRDRC